MIVERFIIWDGKSTHKLTFDKFYVYVLYVFIFFIWYYVFFHFTYMFFTKGRNVRSVSECYRQGSWKPATPRPSFTPAPDPRDQPPRAWTSVSSVSKGTGRSSSGSCGRCCPRCIGARTPDTQHKPSSLILLPSEFPLVYYSSNCAWYTETSINHAAENWGVFA